MKTLMILALTAALTGETLSVTAQSPWKTSPDMLSIDYDGKTYANISASPAVDPDSHYIIRWKMRASAKEVKPVIQAAAEVGDFGNAIRSYCISVSWNDYAFCFFSGSASAVSFKLYSNPSSPKTMEVKDMSITKVDPAQFSINLMPDAYFTAAKDIPVLWRPGYGIPEHPASLVPAEDFLAGEQCMQITVRDPDKGTSIESINIPMLIGKTFQLVFWAKSSADTVITGGVNGWSMYKHTGGHWYKQESFKVTTTWNEYSMRFSIPADLAAYPDLRSQMLLVNFGQKKSDGIVRISGVKFRQIGPQ